MNPHFRQARSRREFLERAGLGFGALATSVLLENEARAAVNPFAAKKPHFQAKGKSVIYLFMHGGSQPH